MMNDGSYCERAGNEYEEDLRVHPNNIWSKYGLYKLVELGYDHSVEGNHHTDGGIDMPIDIKGSCCEMNLC